MHAYLITAGTKEKRDRKAKEIIASLNLAQAGLIEIKPENTGGSIGIDQIKQIKKRLGLKTKKDKQKVCLIKKAHLMTPQAQNAILKNLEEPPQQSVFILTTGKSEQLLQTIHSRCNTITLEDDIDIKLGIEEHKKAIKLLHKLIESSKGEKLEWSYSIRGREKNNVTNLFTYWLTAVREELINRYGKEEKSSTTALSKVGEKQLVKIIKNITKARKNLEQTNVNQQVVVDNLVLRFPEVS